MEKIGLPLLRRAARISDPEGDRVDAMGAIHYQRGQWKEAAAAFEQSLSKQPGNRSRLLYFCSALSRAGETERADRVSHVRIIIEDGIGTPGDKVIAVYRHLQVIFLQK